jgi:hypothetical protein
MKNIHILPTDKHSRLIKNNRGYALITDEFTWSDLDFIQAKFQHIYITSDEEIKEGDWVVLTTINKLVKVEYNLQKQVLEDYNKNHKKIILTTDQDLIKDGVQAIDDEFLEWFVKNPSCENVEVITEQYTQNYHKDIWYNRYKIIIPQEGSIQTQQMEDRIRGLNVDTGYRLQEEPNTNLERLPFPKLIKEFAEYYKKISLVDENNQETLEEAAEKYANDWEEIHSELDYVNITPIEVSKIDFVHGAKWQAERMYSEEDMIDLVEQLKDYTKESHTILGHDKRDAKEFVNIFKKLKKK